MALPDRHPEYMNRVGEWIQMTDTFAGERAVKSKRLDYLPATESMVQDGMTTPSSPGWKDYEAYLLRAYYHNYVREAVQAMIGIIHSKPAVIKLPPRLAGMVDKATIQGEGLQALLRRVNVAQLVNGRLGLLVDAPTGQDVDKALPYIAFYDAMRIINWDAGRLNEGRNALQLVVIDESGYRREGFTWKQERKYRVLIRGNPESIESGWETPGPDDTYQFCVKVNDSSMPVAADFAAPSIAGVTLKTIPFVFCNANDIVPEPDVSPLLTLSNLSLAIYRADADYRQTLYLQGQQTLVIIGMGENEDEDEGTPLRVGNKGLLRLKLSSDAKYVGVSGAGLSEMRQALENDKTMAAKDGAQFLDVGNSQGESGEALRIRVASRTTTLQSVSRAGGLALEQALKYCAEWVGEDPDDVEVIPNVDFADQSVQGATALAFMQAKQLGFPISLKSLHRLAASNDLTEMTYEEETDQIESEAESMLGQIATPMMLGQVTDDSFLDDDHPAVGGPSGATQPTPGQPPQGPAGPAPAAQNTPVTPHVRGSPTPLKKKGSHKGASAGKKNGKTQ